MVAMAWMGAIGGMVAGHMHASEEGGGHGLRGLRWSYARVQCVKMAHVQDSF